MTLSNKLYHSAVSEGYYAMFYLAQYEIGIEISEDEATSVLAGARTFHEAAWQKLQVDK